MRNRDENTGKKLAIGAAIAGAHRCYGGGGRGCNVNGKNKGSSFERATCKALSLWVSDGKKGDLYWRSAMSGGRATVAHRRSIQQSEAAGTTWPSGPPVRQAGDITAVAAEGHKLTDLFLIECKHYRDLDFGLFLFQRGKLWKFWKTAQAEARKYEKITLLIAKQNHTPTVVLSELGCFAEYCKGVDIQFPRMVENCVLFRFDEMLKFSFKTLHEEMA